MSCANCYQCPACGGGYCELEGLTVWVVEAKSESGDSYGPWLFATDPEDRLEALLREWCPCEWPDDDEEGPGWRGSYLHVSVHRTSVEP